MFRNIFKLLRNYIYSLIIPLISPTHTQKKYYVSICGIFKNEAPYLREWIEFYKLIGVEHFYLYNNFSSDNYQEILQPYIASGILTLTDWPHPHGQMSAYQHCLDTYKDETNWLGFIDLDEFIVPNRYCNLKEWLQKHQKQPSAFVYWKFFSSAGNLTENNHLVTETYTLASHVSHTQKTFFNTDWYGYVKNFHIAHIIKLKYFGVYVPDHPLIYYGFCNNIDEIDIQMNHYYCKSYEYQLHKKIPGGLADKDYKQYDLSPFYNYEKICHLPDYHIFAYLIKLKLALSEQPK